MDLALLLVVVPVFLEVALVPLAGAFGGMFGDSSSAFSYSWSTGPWGSCNGNQCGFAGSQTRYVWCTHPVLGDQPLSKCDQVTMPESRRNCFKVCEEHRHLFAWLAGDWEKCERSDNTRLGTCGQDSLGVKTRAIKCIDTSTGFLKEDTREVVPEYICEQFEVKPLTEMECFMPCPQDCIVGSFKRWSECTSTCGNGTQTRVREVVVPPIHGGSLCPHLSETRLCKNNPSCENREFTYFTKVGTWMKCQPPARAPSGGSGVPGIGLQSRSVSCLTGYGVKVEDSRCNQNYNTVVPSKFQSCLVPRDCITTSWSSWSQCPNPCQYVRESSEMTATVYKERKRSITVAPLGGGTLCPKLVDRDPCPNPNEITGLECPSYTWHVTEWGECSMDAVMAPYERLQFGTEGTLCGRGMHQRDVFCTILNVTDFAPVSPNLCNPNLRPEQLGQCEVVCPAPCQVTPWSQWSDCVSDECSPQNSKKLKGHKIRRREVLTKAEQGGVDCPHVEEYAPCDIAYCYSWHAEDLGDCSPVDSTTRCGQGGQQLNITCWDIYHAIVDDEQCSTITPKPGAVLPCWLPCPNDCVVGEWTEWSRCSSVCGKDGMQTRFRNIRAYPGPGGHECPLARHLVEITACNDHSCAQFAWSTSAWSQCLGGLKPVLLEGFDGMCTLGHQTRSVVCVRTLQGKEAPEKRCSELGKPSSVVECHIPCPQDCQVTGFGEWTDCPHTCQLGIGFLHERNRYELRPGKYGGQPCPPLQERQVCPVPDSCYSYDWVPHQWGECQLAVGRQRGNWEACGDGLETREVQCQREGGMQVDVDLCLRYGPPMLAASSLCHVLCEGECELSEWARWTDCTDGCQGTKERRRRLLGQSRRQSHCNDLPLSETTACHCRTYSLQTTGVWSDCFIEPSQFKGPPPSGGLMGDSVGGISGGCGLGVRYRAVMCLDNEGRFADMIECGEDSDFTVEMCEIPCPEDCQLGPWSSWSECSEIMGNGEEMRWREILQEASAVGRPCPTPERGNRIYQRSPCWSEAHGRFLWDVGPYRECEISSNASCGDGHQRREVRCKIDSPPGFYGPYNSSSLCPLQTRTHMTRPCNKPCPGECAVSGWTEWSSCPQNCASVNFHNRTRTILRHPSTEGGITCPPLTQVEPCNLGVECTSYRWNVTGWGACLLQPRAVCGRGKLHRVPRCLMNEEGEEVDWFHCEKLDLAKPGDLEAECTVECSEDCILSAWSEWGDCTQSCGHSVGRTRSRSILRSANQLGRPCASSLRQWRPCKATPCYRWVTGAWGQCLPRGGDCGIGWRQRNVTCQQEDGVIVGEELCQKGAYQSNINVTEQGHERLEREQPCTIPCPGECQHTLWSGWSDCYISCLQERPIGYEGVQVRSRAALGPDRGCPSDEMLIQPCQGNVCYQFNWQTSPWKKGKRDVWCQRSGGLNVTGPCLDSEKPSSTVSCHPACDVPFSFCFEENVCQCRKGYTAKFSEVTGVLQDCMDDWIMVQDRGEEDRILDPTVVTSEPNRGVQTTESSTVENGDNGEGDRQDEDDSKSQGFFASIPAWGYGIVACVGFLILIIIIIIILACCFRSVKQQAEERRKYQHAADYSLYWDDNAKKKYNGEVDL